MSNDDRTDRFRPVFEPEDIFDRFVKNANASVEAKTPRDDEPTGLVQGEEAKPVRGAAPPWDHKVTVRAPVPEEKDEKTRANARFAIPPEALPEDIDEDERTQARAAPLRMQVSPPPERTQVSPPPEPTRVAPRPDEPPGSMTESGQRVVLLTRRKSEPPKRPEDWKSVVAPKGQNTQIAEAKRLVPDVNLGIKQATTYVNEGGEDGQMPTRELDRLLSDMAVLLRYGHAGQVREHLDELRKRFPEDLLLLRRLAEFYVEHEQKEPALEVLFALAGGLFERRNVEGMRQALEQVLVLEPGNQRAVKLLSLLGQRDE
jgi:hypothetical protein